MKVAHADDRKNFTTVPKAGRRSSADEKLAANLDVLRDMIGDTTGSTGTNEELTGTEWLEGMIEIPHEKSAISGVPAGAHEMEPPDVPATGAPDVEPPAAVAPTTTSEQVELKKSESFGQRGRSLLRSWIVNDGLTGGGCAPDGFGEVQFTQTSELLPPGSESVSQTSKNAASVQQEGDATGEKKNFSALDKQASSVSKSTGKGKGNIKHMSRPLGKARSIPQIDATGHLGTAL